MNPEESTYELIERYLDKECSADEAKSIEARMATDQAFADEVDWLKQFRSDMKERTSFRILAEIEQMKLEDQKRMKRKVPWSVGILVSAAIILLLVYKLFGDREEDLKPIMEEYTSASFDERLSEWEEYLPYEKGLQSLGDESEQSLEEALQLIQSDQPKAAIPKLALYLENLSGEEDDFEMRLEYGKILLREELDVTAAKREFSKILQGSALRSFKEEATFYLGLSHLLSGQRDSTEIIWQTVVAEPSHPYYQKVQEVLNTEER